MPLRNVPICLGHLFHHGKHGTLNADLRFLMGFMMVKVRQTNDARSCIRAAKDVTIEAAM